MKYYIKLHWDFGDDYYEALFVVGFDTEQDAIQFRDIFMCESKSKSKLRFSDVKIVSKPIWLREYMDLTDLTDLDFNPDNPFEKLIQPKPLKPTSNPLETIKIIEDFTSDPKYLDNMFETQKCHISDYVYYELKILDEIDEYQLTLYRIKLHVDKTYIRVAYCNGHTIILDQDIYDKQLSESLRFDDLVGFLQSDFIETKDTLDVYLNKIELTLLKHQELKIKFGVEESFDRKNEHDIASEKYDEWRKIFKSNPEKFVSVPSIITDFPPDFLTEISTKLDKLNSHEKIYSDNNRKLGSIVNDYIHKNYLNYLDKLLER